MTPGQAAVLVRNEQEIERAAEELEDLEEMLSESLADSVRGKKDRADGGHKKRRCCIYGSSPHPLPAARSRSPLACLLTRS
jgi:hypothetical protein